MGSRDFIPAVGVKVTAGFESELNASVTRCLTRDSRLTLFNCRGPAGAIVATAGPSPAAA
jgi:hypothetical protein